jgi:hypothetical protein
VEQSGAQTAAIRRKCGSGRNGLDKPNPSPPVANGCAHNEMVGRGRRFQSVRGLQLSPCLGIAFVFSADAGRLFRRPPGSRPARREQKRRTVAVPDLVERVERPRLQRHGSHARLRLTELQLASRERAAHVDDPLVPVDVAFQRQDRGAAWCCVRRARGYGGCSSPRRFSSTLRA